MQAMNQQDSVDRMWFSLQKLANYNRVDKPTQKKEEELQYNLIKALFKGRVEKAYI